jgi:hypothetical protein
MTQVSTQGLVRTTAADVRIGGTDGRRARAIRHLERCRDEYGTALDRADAMRVLGCDTADLAAADDLLQIAQAQLVDAVRVIEVNNWRPSGWSRMDSQPRGFYEELVASERDQWDEMIETDALELVARGAEELW